MAASASRRLRRVIKEYVKTIEQQHPEIKEIKSKLINEFYGEDLLIQNPAGWVPTPWEGFANEKREAVLRFLGARPFSNGINPDGFQLDVQVTDPTGQSVVKKYDRLRFYDDGQVWSTNQPRYLYYRSTPDNKIQIYTDESARNTANLEFKVGDIQKRGSIAIYNILNTVEEKPLTEKEKWVDRIHTALDWAGWIPGYGDIADVINSIWYFAEGEYFEALLSAIAIIPLVGSAMKATIKGAIGIAGASVKGFSRILRNSFKTNDTYKVWDAIINSGKLSKADLKDLGNGLDSLRGIFRKASDYTKDLPGGQAISKQLDDFSGWMKNSRKNIDELSAASKTAADNLAAKGASLNKTISQATDVGLGAARKVVSYIPAVKAEGLFKRLRGMAWFPEKKLVQLAKGMEKRFIKNMAHPTKMMALLKTTPNPGALMTKMLDVKGFEKIVKQEYPELFENATRQIKDASGNIQTVTTSFLKTNIDELLMNSRNSERLTNIFREASKNSGVWREVTDDVARHAISNDSPVWNLYKTDALKALGTTLDYRYMKGFWDTSFAKNADIIYNELQDMGEDLTQEQRDNPTGVVYPIIKAGLNKILPGKVINDVQVFRDKVAENPITKMGLSLAGYSVDKDGAVVKSKNLDYNPFEEAGGSIR